MRKHYRGAVARLIGVLCVALSGTAVVPRVAAQTAEEEAVKKVVVATITAYYARDAETWQAGWAHDPDVTRVAVSAGGYSSFRGWSQISGAMLPAFKNNPTPEPVKMALDNVVVRLDGSLAYLEGDQILTSDSMPNQKRVSREHRVLRKQQGVWKIVSQITHDPDSFGSGPQAIENTVNGTGYRLLEAGKPQEAIEVFKVNVRLYPESWNVYDSLGEAYAVAGQRDLAVENYEKSLKLNPKNDSGLAALAKLKSKQ